MDNNKSEIWQCQNCHYEYEEEKGDYISDIMPHTRFRNLPGDWGCPICGASKDQFKKAD